MTEKWATPTETAKYFKSIPIHPSKQRHFDGLTVSALGAGTQLGPSDEATDKIYEQTLLKQALSGINFFDTAIHYRNQRSEKVLGKVFKELTSQGIPREQWVVATKGGYLPFEGVFEEYVRTHYLDVGVMEPKDIVADCHCMTPNFLAHQMISSLKNLGLQSIDLYYLQNPETQISEVGEEETYRRIKQAFSLFEEKVQEKKIGRYGVATWNGFRVKKGGLQLTKIIECAREIAGEKHHFKAIQLPYNLVMLEAIKRPKLFQLAAENKIEIMISAPLMQGHIKHLAKQVFEQLPTGKFAMAQALEFTLSTPGVCSAFCGMKKPEHWEENSSVLHQSSWPADVWGKACQSMGVFQSPVSSAPDSKR